MTDFIGLLIILVALLIMVTTARRMSRDHRSDALRLYAAVIFLMAAQVGMKLHLIFPSAALAGEVNQLAWNIIDLLTLLTLSAMVKLIARRHRAEDKKNPSED